MLTLDITIMSVGTEITYGNDMVPDEGWVEFLNKKWDKKIASEETSNEDKISLLDVKIIYSGGMDLDVLPQGAVKDKQALERILKPVNLNNARLSVNLAKFDRDRRVEDDRKKERYAYNQQFNPGNEGGRRIREDVTIKWMYVPGNKIKPIFVSSRKTTVTGCTFPENTWTWTKIAQSMMADDSTFPTKMKGHRCMKDLNMGNEEAFNEIPIPKEKVGNKYYDYFQHKKIRWSAGGTEAESNLEKDYIVKEIDITVELGSEVGDLEHDVEKMRRFKKLPNEFINNQC
ncbi:hypothetical protein L1987_82157 [Smallanthus sonchifolius]|uniref:Uncharacterized protein n=1 Tax=Smallanthus sonchifolius TaxID=185202 RepID=A0ACB8YA68_9ASTR|nr:hypothetical protein L1987_82157 [Smallanthus sonchifolius]